MNFIIFVHKNLHENCARARAHVASYHEVHAASTRYMYIMAANAHAHF